jgi:hypothetical protein
MPAEEAKKDYNCFGDFRASRSIEPPTESSFEIYSEKILVISNIPQVLVYI